MAAIYLLKAIETKLSVFICTNATRAMPAEEGKEPLLGTGQMAVRFPGGKEGDFILEISPTVAARVHI